MGRRVTIIINAMVFILGAIVLAVSPNFTTLVRKYRDVICLKIPEVMVTTEQVSY